jgi:hypothetical protein
VRIALVLLTQPFCSSTNPSLFLCNCRWAASSCQLNATPAVVCELNRTKHTWRGRSSPIVRPSSLFRHLQPIHLPKPFYAYGVSRAQLGTPRSSPLKKALRIFGECSVNVRCVFKVRTCARTSTNQLIRIDNPSISTFGESDKAAVIAHL